MVTYVQIRVAFLSYYEEDRTVVMSTRVKTVKYI